MTFNYDLLVIGAGSSGIAAAKQAAKYGAKVAITESQELGGVCVNQGCISKKLMVYASDFADLANDAADYGWQIRVEQFDWQRFRSVRDQEVERLRQVQEKVLTQAGVDIVRSHATFIDPHTLDMGDRKLTADKILLAVGGKPLKPKLPGIEHTITSREIFNLPNIPQRLAIIGSGYIGVEFASIFCSLGVEVTLMDKEDSILKGFDDDLRNHVRSGLIKRGIQSFGNTTAERIEKTAEGIQLTLEGDRAGSLTVDTVLCAVGRVPNLEGLNLENAGVEVEGKAIAVDQYSRTSQPHIFAVGDCTNRLPLTPVARAEGRAFADTAFGNHPQPLDYTHVPSAVFARPEAATVGLSEAQAQQQHGAENIRCYRAEFHSLYRSVNRCPDPSLIKLVIHQASKQVLGVHIICEHAAEIIQGIAVTVKKGVTKQELDDMIGVHPTSAEEFFTSL
ncbi:MAG: glutathione-disulfide reductase [Oscillatoriales cyanobacterium C42_A2020_001]|nr:glutathione-disulfide reductase [Leptolyngbyaceae cyanobacterium C42_A2020_001]